MDEHKNLPPNLVLMAAEEGGRQVMALQAEVARLEKCVAELAQENSRYRSLFGALDVPPYIFTAGGDDVG